MEQVSYPVQSSFIAINVNVLSGVADTINFDLFNYLLIFELFSEKVGLPRSVNAAYL